MIYKEYKNESYNLYTIKTDKFKTCHMEIIFYDEFKKDNITAINFLTDMLTHSSYNYPRRKDVSLKQEDLYNASFYGVTSRVGKVRTINFNYNFIDPKYADKSYLKEVIKFPFDMLFNPNIKNGEFDLRSFNIIKSRIQADIDSIKESPTRYAIKKGLQFMDDKHPASYELVGNSKELSSISQESLVDTYNEVINNYKCDIYVSGNLDMDKIDMMINEYFRNNIIQNKKLDIYIDEVNPKKVKEKVETDSFCQSTLVCILNTCNLTDYEKNIGIMIYNYILGQGSLNSKLKQNLREKNSLCYTVNSIYQKYDNLMIIYAGIDKKNKDKAIKLVKKSLKEMVNGDFDDEDVLNAIKNIINSYNMSLSNLSSLTTNYFFHNLANVPFINDRMKEVNNVSKKDVINIAKKIKMNTIYMMAGDNNEGN